MIKELLLQIKAVQSVSKEVAQVRAELTGLGAHVDRLSKHTASLTKEQAAQEKTAKKSAATNKQVALIYGQMNQKIKGVGSQIGGLKKEIDALNKGLLQMAAQSKNTAQGMDQVKKASRLTAEGFKAMLIQQAAWMAGFAIVLAPLHQFISLLAEATDMATQFARTTRVMYDETGKRIGDMTEVFAKMQEGMVKTGLNAKEASEIMYQLGSAGLSAKEAMAAFASTLDAVQGAEADVGLYTKLVAGIFNNMGEQIYKTAGGMTVFVTEAKAIEQELIKVTDLQEKFTAINDRLVAVFDRHQVEMNELQDGLKYSAATAQAAGISFDELLAILATLNDQLIKSGIAGRSFQTFISRLSRDPQAMKNAFKIEFDETKPIEIMNILAQIRANMDEGALGMDDIGKAFERFGLRGARTFITLVKSIDVVNHNLRDMRMHAEGAAERMAEIMRATPDVAFKRFRQEMVMLTKISFGPLIDGFVTFVKYINRGVEGVILLNEHIAGFSLIGSKLLQVGAFLLLGKAVTFAVQQFEWLRKALLFMFPVFAKQGAAIVALTQKLWKLIAATKTMIYLEVLFAGTAGAAAAGLLGGVVVAIGAMIGATVKMGQKIKKTTDRMDEMMVADANFVKGSHAWLKYNQKRIEGMKKAVNEAYDLVEATDLLTGIDIGEEANAWEKYFRARTGWHGTEELSANRMAIIQHEINDSLYGRIIAYGREHAMTREIAATLRKRAHAEAENLANIELTGKTENELQQILEQRIARLETARKLTSEILDLELKTIETQRQQAETRLSINASFKFLDEISSGAGTGAEIMEDFNDTIVSGSIMASKLSIDAMSDYFDYLKMQGNFTKDEQLDLYQRFQQVSSAALKAATERTQGLTIKLREARDTLRNLTIGFSEMKQRSLENIGALRDVFGVGVSGAASLRERVKESERETEELKNKMGQLKKEISEIGSLRDNFDKYNDLTKQLKTTTDQYNQSLSKTSSLRQTSQQLDNDTISFLNEQQSRIRDTLEIHEEYARQQQLAASYAKRGSKEQIVALKLEQKYLGSQTKLLREEAASRSALLDVFYSKGLMKEEEYYRRKADLSRRFVGQQVDIDRRLEQSQLELIQAQLIQTAKIEQQQQDAIKAQTDLTAAIGKLSEKFTFSDLDLSGAESKFTALAHHIQIQMAKARDAVSGLSDEINNLPERKTIELIVNETRNVKEQSEQFGGVVQGGAVRVTAGEGYVPPAIAKYNMATLNALNQGCAVPAPNIPVQKFVGPSGIDNIHTSLPSGSYVISKRGMAALDRVQSAKNERSAYQLGGSIGAETSIGQKMNFGENKPIASFELTLVTGENQKKTYPVFGEPSVVDEIKRHLERENMTRL